MSLKNEKNDIAGPVMPGGSLATDPEEQYQNALKTMRTFSAHYALQKAADTFFSLGDYKDAQQLGRECLEKAEGAKKDAILIAANRKMTGELLTNYEAALELLAMIPGWKDADEQAHMCRDQIGEIKRKAEAARLYQEEQAILAERLFAQKRRRTKRWIRLLAVMAAVVLVGWIGGTLLRDCMIIPEQKYQEAVSLLEAGETEAGYAILQQIGNYRNAAEKAGAIRLEAARDALQDAKPGDSVLFGAFEQDNKTENGKEAIEWLVLDRKDNRVLLLSKLGLDCQPYNKKMTDVTWETSYIRKWLNRDFWEQAFSKNEQAVIPTVTVSDVENPKHGTQPSNDTQDRIFLLSSTEAAQYFATDEDRQAQRSAYTKKKHAFVRMENQYCWWWLRSPASKGSNATSVYVTGEIFLDGNSVNRTEICVRPALWIELEP